MLSVKAMTETGRTQSQPDREFPVGARDAALRVKVHLLSSPNNGLWA